VTRHLAVEGPATVREHDGVLLGGCPLCGVADVPVEQLFDTPGPDAGVLWLAAHGADRPDDLEAAYQQFAAGQGAAS